MTKFFSKLKKPYFWSTFPIFGVMIFKKKKNPALSRTLYEFLTPCENLGKTNNPIPRKFQDRRTGPISKGLSGYRQGSNN